MNDERNLWCPKVCTGELARKPPGAYVRSVVRVVWLFVLDNACAHDLLYIVFF